MALERNASGSLASLPQVLAGALDAAFGEGLEGDRLAVSIRTDPGLSAGVLTAARMGAVHRGPQGDSDITAALATLGIERVRDIVIASSLQQYLAPLDPRLNRFLQRFWCRSLLGAHAARALAALARYPDPEQAYLAGLLRGVGQLELLRREGEGYLERLEACTDLGELRDVELQVYGKTHCDVAAELADHWTDDPFFADALRYQGASLEDVRDAHQLVRVVCLAGGLGDSDGCDGAVVDGAVLLLGLEPELTQDLCARVAADVDRTANAVGVGMNGDSDREAAARQSLASLLEPLGCLAQVKADMLRALRHGDVQATAQRAAWVMLGVRRGLLFVVDADGERLGTVLSRGQPPAFVVPVAPGRSLVTDALLAREPRYAEAGRASGLAVVDRQILNWLRSEAFGCLPLVHAGRAMGVLVVGADVSEIGSLRQRPARLRVFGEAMGAALGSGVGELKGIEHASTPPVYGDRGLREIVHEASNPLSVISNYLETLRFKLGQEHEAQGDLQLIREEITRVGEILARLRSPLPAARPLALVLNEGVRQIAPIFTKSLFDPRGIRLDLDLDLDESGPPVAARLEHLHQILGNLLKNAAEALSPGDEVRVSTRNRVSVGGRSHALLTVEDTGPGVPPHVISNLFSPVVSTKGAGHAGLGLSIVRNLMDELGGAVMCVSDATGARFQLLFPKVEADQGSAPGAVGS